MRLLDFIVIGAGRAGTTWVYRLLRQNPDCFVPRQKELSYFNEEPLDPRVGINRNYRQPVEWYHRFFEDAGPGQILGEISPAYLWSETAPFRIKDYNPGIKLVALLRDPMERSYSHYLYRLQRGNLPRISFAEAIEREPFILTRSLYGRYLSRYFALFSRDQVKVLFHETLRSQPEEFAGQLSDYLGIRRHAPETNGPVNPSGVSLYPRTSRAVLGLTLFLQRHPKLDRAARSLRRGRVFEYLRARRRATRPIPAESAVDASTEQRVRDFFRSDIDALEALLDIDLSHWKGGPIARNTVPGMSA